jgi:hypothetical protein
MKKTIIDTALALIKHKKNQYSQMKDIATSNNASAQIAKKTLENTEAYVP